jgi:hypothetical protein
MLNCQPTDLLSFMVVYIGFCSLIVELIDRNAFGLPLASQGLLVSLLGLFCKKLCLLSSFIVLISVYDLNSRLCNGSYQVFIDVNCGILCSFVQL